MVVKRVLRYLKGTVDFGFHHVRGEIKLNAYCDSDWANNLDEKHNTTCYRIFLGNSPIS